MEQWNHVESGADRTFSSFATSFLNAMHNFFIQKISQIILMSLIQGMASPPALQSPLKNIIFTIKTAKTQQKIVHIELYFKTNRKKF